MRIAQISPIVVRVPPPAHGGVELVVHYVTEELVKQGHEVTLFASGDSVTTAQLHSITPTSLRTAGITDHNSSQISIEYDVANAAACFGRAGDFDIIHNNAGFPAMIMAQFVATPVLTTLHRLLTREYDSLWPTYKGYYNTLSRSAKGDLPNKGYLGAVYNAIDCQNFPFAGKGEGYLLFLSRISPLKGAHTAIQVAKRVGRSLTLAGNIESKEQEYFEKEVLPLIDGRIVKFFGEADREQKKRLFAGADCLLFPIDWEEPFGLVMVEAMACGTPVIALNRGAVSEVVVDGGTGFIVGTVDEMVDAVGRIGEIDRRRCREHVERNFNVPRMVDNYLVLYQRILDIERQDSGV